MTQFDRQYRECLSQILSEGVEEVNERTGHRTRAVAGVHFRIDGAFPLLTLRRIPVKVFVAEQIWFLMGSRKPSEFLDQYTRIWQDFTNINGIVSTAYGYRWRHHFGRDQIAGLVRLLENEPSSRHGVVITWDPADDGLMPGRKKKNVPCPFAFTVNVFGGKLHLHNMVRSNDMVLGFPHDVAGFALLQRILAARLGLGVGVYSHSVSNAHVYDVHYEAAAELVRREGQAAEIHLSGEPRWFERAEAGDKMLVEEIAGLINAQYRPDAAIKGLPIVV